MAKRPKKPEPEVVEIEPDAWELFERTMDKIVLPKRSRKPEMNEPDSKATRKRRD